MIFITFSMWHNEGICILYMETKCTEIVFYFLTWVTCPNYAHSESEAIVLFVWKLILHIVYCHSISWNCKDDIVQILYMIVCNNNLVIAFEPASDPEGKH